MPFAEEREAIIGVLEFTGEVLEYLMTRLGPEDRLVFEDAWYGETKPQLELAIRTLRGLPLEEDIRRRAQEIYEARGRETGREVWDWERAEAEFREAPREGGWLHSFLRRVGLNSSKGSFRTLEAAHENKGRLSFPLAAQLLSSTEKAIADEMAARRKVSLVTSTHRGTAR